MSNSTHRVNVVKIEEILPCPNADNLGIVYIGGYQCVVQKAAYKAGDLALYIQPDTVVPVHPAFSFLWDNIPPQEVIPERKRRITVRKFRGNWSEGLLMPVSEFETKMIPPGMNHPVIMQTQGWEEGDDVAELLGFTHYEEPDPSYVLGKQGRKLTLWQRILKFFGFGYKPYGPKDGPGQYDVESVKNYPRALAEGEEVIATEKIHGSNARYYFDGDKKKPTFWVGSHNKWWKDKTNIWWRVAEKNPWIEAFCRANPKHTLRGEVTPTQKGYQYGNTPEEQFFAFDVQCPDGSYVDKQRLVLNGTFPLLNSIMKTVPVVYSGPYDAAKLKELAEGMSLVDGAKHIREGVVISSATERTVRGLGRAQLKLKSLKFLEKEVK
jgi:hypothetical protein